LPTENRPNERVIAVPTKRQVGQVSVDQMPVGQMTWCQKIGKKFDFQIRLAREITLELCYKNYLPWKLVPDPNKLVRLSLSVPGQGQGQVEHLFRAPFRVPLSR
jgi:hypothetical protein